MALLDVTDILGDPDFSVAAGEIVVQRRAQTVGTNGVNVEVVSTIDISAPPYLTVVIAADSSVLNLMPDLARGSGLIEVITTFALSGPEPGLSPDLVIWNPGTINQPGTYTVERISNLQNFGAGFTIAVCALRDV